MSTPLGSLIEDLLGPDLPVGVVAYDGTRLGPPDPPATVSIRSPDALRRILTTAGGELGFGRAYVAGDLDVEGDMFAALALRDRMADPRLRPRQWLAVARLAGISGLRPPPPPPEEARLRGRLHSRARDAAAIAHHYDVSNRFYEMVIGPSLTYSCAVWPDPSITLEEAQAAKHDLICRKLDLRPGMRLLDVGCGWGTLAIHAATHYGVSAVGVTVARRQVELAGKRVAEAGLSGRVEIRDQDYRDVADRPYDAIASVGMFEHVGSAQLRRYFGGLWDLLRPGGRFLNHAISQPPQPRHLLARPGFLESYVFPDGELLELGATVTAMQRAGFEVRHEESLREHYALTLRRWIANLESHWDEAVAEVGRPRARIWRLYMAGAALNFEANRTQVHQVLGVRPDAGASGMPLRPGWA
ncbi:MAG: class I SAM-dependent methyltransferase [Acidimicrobiales bacterium]